LNGPQPLWNSTILVASASAIFRLYEQSIPEVVHAMFDRLAGPKLFDPEHVRAFYFSLPKKDLYRDVLRGSRDLISVMPVPPCGWRGRTALTRKPSISGAVG
jgi:hypothetical protein